MCLDGLFICSRSTAPLALTARRSFRRPARPPSPRMRSDLSRSLTRQEGRANGGLAAEIHSTTRPHAARAACDHQTSVPPTVAAEGRSSRSSWVCFLLSGGSDELRSNARKPWPTFRPASSGSAPSRSTSRATPAFPTLSQRPRRLLRLQHRLRLATGAERRSTRTSSRPIRPPSTSSASSSRPCSAHSPSSASSSPSRSGSSAGSARRRKRQASSAPSSFAGTGA